MADRLTIEQRSRNMAAVRNKHTAPEMHIRSTLLERGLRCTTHNANIPGRPDLVFNAYKAVIFVHGCFWHMHDCAFGKLPISNNLFWHKKIQGNVERDLHNTQKLYDAGWRVKVIWLCELKNKKTCRSEEQADALAAWIRNDADKD
jgi:DNA mismatch endonuclease (patch repair protein)